MMRVELSDGSILPEGCLWQGRLRTDLVPSIANVELLITANARYDALLTIDKTLTVDGWPMTVVKHDVLNSRLVSGLGSVHALHKITAMLTPCLPIALPSSRALGLNNTTFAAVYRACGASIRFASDIPLKRFNLSKGEVPSMALARRLQDEGAVIFGQLDAQNQPVLRVLRIVDVLKQAPILSTAKQLSQGRQSSPMVVGLTVPNAYSADEEGASSGLPLQVKNRMTGFAPNRSERELRNMGQVLQRHSVQTVPYQANLQAGQVVMVGQLPCVVLTCAQVVEGMPSRPASQQTMLWLASDGRSPDA